jgi:hypothetical protein
MGDPGTKRLPFGAPGNEGLHHSAQGDGTVPKQERVPRYTKSIQEYSFTFFFWKFQFVDSCVSTWESTSCCLFFFSSFYARSFLSFRPSFCLFILLSLSLFMLCSSRHFVHSNFKYHNFI